MALFCNLMCRSHNILLRNTSAFRREAIHSRRMSQYSPIYVRPVPKKEDIAALKESGEIQQFQFVPVRSSLPENTCSLREDPLVTLFVNYLMRDGKKILARTLIQKAFEKVKRLQLEKYHKCTDPVAKEVFELDPLRIFKQAVDNCKPIMHVVEVQRGGVTYQVPTPISEVKSRFYAMKWILAMANEKDSSARFKDILALELIDAANNTGRVVRQKRDLHKLCETNRAYAHYRWRAKN